MTAGHYTLLLAALLLLAIAECGIVGGLHRGMDALSEATAIVTAEAGR